MTVRVLVNESYWTQRITGQQRYATEIARRLERASGYRPVRPSGFWAGSALRVWAWVQLVLPIVAQRRLVLSMTSRAPLWRRRHVLVVHDLFVLTNPEWFSRRYVWTHAPLLRAQLRSAAVVVAVSRPVADQVARLRPGPVLVAPNAPSEVFRAAGGTDRRDDALDARELEAGTYFLAVGSRDPRKNLARLVEAYAGLTDVERSKHPLVLVGGGSSIFRGEDVGSVDGVVDAGYVSDEELAQLYRGARCVVFISRAEGFGLPIVEAAAAGAPSLLLSDIEVFRWICGDDARYVDAESVEAVRDGLRAEIEEPGCRKVDIERFDWDTSAAVIAEACVAAAT
jgi:glycosyltransferase involved in cell wall biosynthesis